ncbi:Methyltransf-21 domain-containing protein [Aphelenchoides besseyi]|nr:Methyltransf-21 domain-containing protein [Aphelenchoides besseyi]
MSARTTLLALFLLVCGLVLLWFVLDETKHMCRQLQREQQPLRIDNDYDNDHHTHIIADVKRQCRYDTGVLIQSLRDSQRRLNRVWHQLTKSPKERWSTLPEIFDPATNGFKLLLQPFKYYSGDENKFFLPFSNPNSICHHVTVGVGGVWDGEKSLRNKYPQCELLGIDPSYENHRIVESIPRSTFLHAALHEKGGNLSADLLDDKGYYRGKVVPHRPFYEVLIQTTNGHTIDFMTIDTEGAEFSLLKTIHSQRHLFAKICQFNMEIHYARKHYEVSLDEFDELFNSFLDKAHFVLLNVAYRGVELRQLFFLNVGDEECIQKFLC